MDSSACLDFVRELRALNHRLDARLNEGLRPLGISCVQADALMALQGLQPCGLKDLSTHLIAESGHPSRLVARMRRSGLVEVAPSPEDGRAMLISLTAKGERLAKESCKVRQNIIDSLVLDDGALADATGFVQSIIRQLF
ncbi:MarR family winged helix-turn-helix transcriptional regulator [Bifidobacterium sp. ESL0798]|uniref:MarR family winged helix-turn-helix transcriptional regulator n=1 Tax=Bifidobacterium sp. ESL0798 TaxID=2983235 RepID=UPI0023F95AC7|nr:MarR family winged helix-turn-helix transcriptional regulator [Bifidobacterium sp. ESL0798]WEV74431.1 MarR family winged helix-turn-helix transcriptional regulator [Bifidobacterium sp. ESL0798]